MADAAEDLQLGEISNSEAAEEGLRLVEGGENASTGLVSKSDFSAKKRAASGKHEEGEGNWLVSYADMMTLLVGFFVMLMSFSKIDTTAFEKIKKETTKIFGGEYKIPFEDAANKIKQVVSGAGLDSSVNFEQNDAGITITFRGALFFDSGSAIMRDEATNLLATLIPTIQEQAKDFGILVEGHTDNAPIKSKLFASNWELSSVRACSVLRLFEEKGFPKNRLKALGWGETRPIVPNEDATGNHLTENQAQNRRVVIKILKNWED